MDPTAQRSSLAEQGICILSILQTVQHGADAPSAVPQTEVFPTPKDSLRHRQLAQEVRCLVADSQGFLWGSFHASVSYHLIQRSFALPILCAISCADTRLRSPQAARGTLVLAMRRRAASCSSRC